MSCVWHLHACIISRPSHLISIQFVWYDLGTQMILFPKQSLYCVCVCTLWSLDTYMCWRLPTCVIIVTFSLSFSLHTDNTSEYQDALQELTGRRTVPNIFINGKSVGGCDDIIALHSSGQLAKLLLEGQQARDPVDPNHSYDYDVVVIGGGSGGLACAKVSI